MKVIFNSSDPQGIEDLKSRLIEESEKYSHKVSCEGGAGSRREKQYEQATNDGNEDVDYKEQKLEGKARWRKKEYVVYKYFDRQRIPLHEAVLINGLPAFLKYDCGEMSIVKNIVENSRVLRSPNPEEYPYYPYEFADLREVEQLLEEVKKHRDIGCYYRKCKSVLSKYNDQDEYKLNLLAGDIAWSYLQDKFGTTHYCNIIGDNGSGKSSLGLTFEILGYRPVNMTDPSAANLFRVLGTVEAGQCTIIAEEADKIDKSLEIMSILKTGYHSTGKVARINLNAQQQEFFWTYCYKLIISEKSLNRETAKGVLDRTFVVHTYKGSPKYDIKEVLNPAGDRGRQTLLDEIMIIDVGVQTSQLFNPPS